MELVIFVVKNKRTQERMSSFFLENSNLRYVRFVILSLTSKFRSLGRRTGECIIKESLIILSHFVTGTSTICEGEYILSKLPQNNACSPIQNWSQRMLCQTFFSKFSHCR